MYFKIEKAGLHNERKDASWFMHQTVLVVEMTIIIAVSGHHQQLWVAVSQLFCISPLKLMMSHHVLKVFSIN